MKFLIAYLRVSTQKQGKTTLGLDAQRALIEAYARQNGCEVIAEYIEVESGRRNDRPELFKALAHAKRAKATLTVAKLSRLTRNMTFLNAVNDAKVDFLACDNPNAGPMVIQILTAVNEDYVRTVSKETKAALAEAKKRGVKLGAHNPKCVFTAKTREKALTVRRKNAWLATAPYESLIHQLHEKGASLTAIARELTRRGIKTRHGYMFRPMQVKRILERTKSDE